MSARISVVITSYNQKDLLAEAIESVLAQTYRPCEILVCDDASTDGSRELIRSYESRFAGLIKGILHPANMGISKNRSSGLENVHGDLVTWLDGDDRFKPRKLERELDALGKDPDARWVYSQVDVIDPAGKKLRTRYNNPPSGYIIGSLVSMLGSAPRNQLVYYDSLKTIGFFRHDLRLYEDYELCLRLAVHFKAVYCPEPLVEYRTNPEGLHTLPMDLHIESFRKLFAFFQEQIADFPEEEKTMLEKKLAERISAVAGQNVEFSGITGRASFFRTLLGKLR